MFKNAHYDRKKSKIHLWEQIDGEDLYHCIPFVPYVFLPSEDDTDIKTIFGKSVKKETFNNYYGYYNFLQENNSPDVFENKARNEIQFLAEKYYGIPDDELYVPTLKIYYIDIEVITGEGFPDPKDPKDPVVLASIRNGLTGETITFGYDLFGSRNYNGNTEKLKYYACDSEKDLMRYFFSYLNKYPCDVMSGYNIWAFDLPYMINRAKELWGEDKGKDIYSRMSPINVVNIWKQDSSEALNIDMGGLTILDYYNVYKWYGKNLERYTLEYVSQIELKKGKLENPYSSINELARRDWDRFVDYNVIDCERVNDLENQLGYIRMIQALSLLCKSPMKFYNAQTQLIEGLMLTYFRRNNLCAPHFAGGKQADFKAAWVKEPEKGLFEWVVDVDITSSYPSHIITLNMSNETFKGKILFQEGDIISYTRNRNFPPFKMTKDGKNKIEFSESKLDKFNLALRKGLLAISPNGSVFSTKKEGVVAEVEKNLFFKRKEVKDKRYEYGMKANECEDGSVKQRKYKEREKELNSLQLALKVMMNAFFGILSVPYSRYFNVNIAEAITAGGRHTIKSGERFCNELLNNPIKSLQDILILLDAKKTPNEKKDYIKYIDTDSLFVGLGDWINDWECTVWKKLNDDTKIKVIKKISGIIEKYIDDRIYNEIQIADYNSQVHDFRIGFKQEIIAKTALFVKKKKYAYWILDKEGVPKNDIKVTGLEIVRSESAEAIRPKLKEIMDMIMKLKGDDVIAKSIRKFKKELSVLKPEELAANVGINNIKKYLKNNNFPKKATPWHVKGVYGYRLLLNELGLSDRYEDIKEGFKAKVVYIKRNPYNIETISFYNWPEEFETLIQFDSGTMIDKFFIRKVRLLLEPIGKEHLIDFDMSAVRAFF